MLKILQIPENSNLQTVIWKWEGVRGGGKIGERGVMGKRRQGKGAKKGGGREG